MATTNDRARRRLASLQKQLKSSRTDAGKRRIKAEIKNLHSDQAARKAGTPTRNDRRGAALKARQASVAATTRKVGKTTVARRKPAAKKVVPVTKIRGKVPVSTAKPKTVAPTNEMSQPGYGATRLNSSSSQERKDAKQKQHSETSKKAHKRPPAKKRTLGSTLGKAAKSTVARGVASVKKQAAKNRAEAARKRNEAPHKLKKIPTRPSPGAVAGKKIGQAVKKKGAAAIAAFRKKVIAAKRAADARKRNKAGHKLKKSPTRKPAKKKSWWDRYGK